MREGRLVKNNVLSDFCDCLEPEARVERNMEDGEKRFKFKSRPFKIPAKVRCGRNISVGNVDNVLATRNT